MTQSVNLIHLHPPYSNRVHPWAMLRAILGSGALWFVVLILAAILSGCGDGAESHVTAESTRGTSRAKAGAVQQFKTEMVGEWEVCFVSEGVLPSEKMEWIIREDGSYERNTIRYSSGYGCTVAAAGKYVDVTTGKLLIQGPVDVDGYPKTDLAVAIDDHRVQRGVQSTFYNIGVVLDGKLHFGLLEDGNTGYFERARPVRLAPTGYTRRK